jgi:hypothetical protein
MLTRSVLLKLVTLSDIPVIVKVLSISLIM